MYNCLKIVIFNKIAIQMCSQAKRKKEIKIGVFTDINIPIKCFYS